MTLALLLGVAAVLILAAAAHRGLRRDYRGLTMRLALGAITYGAAWVLAWT